VPGHLSSGNLGECNFGSNLTEIGEYPDESHGECTRCAGSILINDQGVHRILIYNKALAEWYPVFKSKNKKQGEFGST